MGAQFLSRNLGSMCQDASHKRLARSHQEFFHSIYLGVLSKTVYFLIVTHSVIFIDKLAEWLWRVTQVFKLGSDFHLVLCSRFERSVGSNPTLVIFALSPPALNRIAGIAFFRDGNMDCLKRQLPWYGSAEPRLGQHDGFHRGMAEANRGILIGAIMAMKEKATIDDGLSVPLSELPVEC